MVSQFRIVIVSNPTETVPPASKKSAYSHAFRQAHAEKRRKQIEKHRREKASNPANDRCTRSDHVVSSPFGRALQGNKDPFASLARSLSSVEHFLLNHYVSVVVPFTLGHCGLFDRPGDHRAQLLREWLGLAITDNALMIAAILLSTCRYILRVQPDNSIYAEMALQYKQTSLQALQQDMAKTSAPIRIITVAKAIALALDEVSIGEHAIAYKHLSGIHAMVHASGGLEKLGLTGLLQRMYQRLTEWLQPKGCVFDHSCSHPQIQVC